MCTLPKLEQDHYYSPPLERMKMKMIALKKFTRRMTITTGAKMDKIWVKHSILDKHNSNEINSQFFKCVCFIWISIHFHGNFLYPTTSGSLAWFPFNFCPQTRFNLCIPGLSSISCIFFVSNWFRLSYIFFNKGVCWICLYIKNVFLLSQLVALYLVCAISDTGALPHQIKTTLLSVSAPSVTRQSRVFSPTTPVSINTTC